jgi:hypothetical protein
MAADIRIDGMGGLYRLTTETEEGREWYDYNVDDDGTPYTDSTQYAYDIANAATEDGLRVAVNGHLFLAGGLRGEAA